MATCISAERLHMNLPWRHLQLAGQPMPNVATSDTYSFAHRKTKVTRPLLSDTATDWQSLWKRVHQIDYSYGKSIWLEVIYGKSLLLRTEEKHIFWCRDCDTINSTENSIFSCPTLSSFWTHNIDLAMIWIPSWSTPPPHTLIEYLHGWPTSYHSITSQQDRLRLQLIYMLSLVAIRLTRARLRTDYHPDRAKIPVLTELLILREEEPYRKLFRTTALAAISLEDMIELIDAARTTREAREAQTTST